MSKEPQNTTLDLSDLAQVAGGAVGLNYQQGHLKNITLFTYQDDFFWNSTAKDDARTLHAEFTKIQKNGNMNLDQYIQLIKSAEVTTWDGKKVDSSYRDKVISELNQRMQKA